MAEFPNEANLIEAAYGLLSNADNWYGNPPNQNPESVEWREAARGWRDEYHNWLGYYCFTHQNDPEEEPTTWELIEALKLVCPCGECDGAWLSRDEAEAIIRRLKTLAVQDRDSSTTG